ncbi:uncharacterized protein LOC120659499 [Panicum virgatum]|uniref:uncharacterized protein LOC120659499 n=1 Tax=Panicum virgatum TaxID=38727 RepID=UPI0019D4F9C2|nr:uncharacterized protein LOC120659499 [Panicum virgatum]
MAPPPELMPELVEEILLRVPPDVPACLARAALVSKPWRCLLSDPAFRRRYRAFHRAPPLLGFIHGYFAASARKVPLFVPAVTPSPFPQRALRADFAGWCVLDCRHGRVLFGIPGEGLNLVVWDPTTGKRQGLPEPPVRRQAYNAAVLCAVRGCDHLDSHSGPFFVVLVGDGNGATGSHLYSSEAGAWNASADLGSISFAKRKPSALVGDDLYFVLAPGDIILKYNLGKNCLSIIHPPEAPGKHGDILLVPMEDGSLGLARLKCS